jgi:hypothetical protein
VSGYPVVSCLVRALRWPFQQPLPATSSPTRGGFPHYLESMSHNLTQMSMVCQARWQPVGEVQVQYLDAMRVWRPTVWPTSMRRPSSQARTPFVQRVASDGFTEDRRYFADQRGSCGSLAFGDGMGHSSLMNRAYESPGQRRFSRDCRGSERSGRRNPGQFAGARPCKPQTMLQKPPPERVPSHDACLAIAVDTKDGSKTAQTPTR